MVFKPGQSGNPKGRPVRPEIEEFRKALEKVSKEKDMSLLESIIRRAYKSDVLANAALKKMLPDLNIVEGDGMKTVIKQFIMYNEDDYNNTKDTSREL